MDASVQDLEKLVPLEAMLGYLNFSEGKPDARFQKNVSDAFAILAERGHQMRLVTSKPTVYANRILRHFSIDRFFRFVYGPDLSLESQAPSLTIRLSDSPARVLGPRVGLLSMRVLVPY